MAWSVVWIQQVTQSHQGHSNPWRNAATSVTSPTERNKTWIIGCWTRFSTVVRIRSVV
jgi:hypothetical protein